MIPEALLLAALLGAPPGLVSTVYAMSGLDGVVVVAHESQFHERALRIERDRDGWAIGTSWGLFQLFDVHHEQHRDDLLWHIVVGTEFLSKCKQGRTLAQAYSVFNSGNERTSIAVGRRIERRRDELARFIYLK